MKVNLYSPKLKSASSFALPKEFSEKVNEPLLAQALHVYRDRKHPGNSRVQTRADVSLTKAKWFRQKGTGRARHGAKSAPLFVGGGVAHGPKGVKKTLELPKKMKQKALVSALSLKAKDGRVAAVKDLSAVKKTKEAQSIVVGIQDGEKLAGKKRLTIAVADKNKGISKFMKNIPNVSLVLYSDLNAYRVYTGGRLVVDVDAFDLPAGRQGSPKKETVKK